MSDKCQGDLSAAWNDLSVACWKYLWLQTNRCVDFGYCFRNSRLPSDLELIKAWPGWVGCPFGNIEKQAASISTKTENDPQNTEKGPASCMKRRGKTTRKRQEAQDFSASAGFPWEQGRLPDGGDAQKSGKVRNPECGGPYITPVEHCIPMVYTCCGEDITGGT